MVEKESAPTPLLAPELSLCMAVYGQPKMLEVWWKALRAYPNLCDQLEFVVVDDCGEPPVTVPVDVRGMIHVQLLRVQKNIPWNQPGARNLAATVARGRVLCLLDPDMVIRPEDIELFLKAAKKLDPKRVLCYALRHQGGRIDTSSPNTYIIHKASFLEAGGYDEDYCGRKGWSDVQLLHILSEFYRVGFSKTLAVDYYQPSQVSDARVESLPRHIGQNKQLHLRKIAEMRSVGGWRNWVRKRKGKNLRFPWKRIL